MMYNMIDRQKQIKQKLSEKKIIETKIFGTYTKKNYDKRKMYFINKRSNHKTTIHKSVKVHKKTKTKTIYNIRILCIYLLTKYKIDTEMMKLIIVDHFDKLLDLILLHILMIYNVDYNPFHIQSPNHFRI